jgi:predicted ATPase/DNA-binding SARP family transcriptional activator
MPGLTLTLFGPPCLTRDDVALRLRSRKCIALLAYLAVTGRSHTRPELSVLFWPESDSTRARGSLRHTLSLLRTTLDDAWLVADRSSVGLDGTHTTAVDVARFRGLLDQYRAHDHGGDQVCPQCLSLLDQAVEIYQGDFLSGFTLRDSPGFDDWQSLETESLRREVTHALEQLARGRAALGDPDRAAQYARRWLALDPLNEAAHRCAMRLYAQCGRRSEALLQYEACAQLLFEELGVPPDPETTALSEAIVESRFPEIQTGPLAVPAVAAPLQHNLPRQPTPFIGREGELAQIAQLLDDPSCRLLTILGPGGIGKSRLAIEAAQSQLRSFDHGVWFVPLASVESKELLPSTIMEALDAAIYGSTEPRPQLLNYLADKNLLLILDNFEHLIEEASLVAELLGAAPLLKVLVTSRERLSLREEWLMPLEGMQFPHPDEFAGAREQDFSALQLFAQCARRVRPDYSLTSAGPDSVARICQLVEGMPLAIELAAPWLQVMPCHDIAKDLERSLDFLATTLRDMPPRHRSIQAVFDHSWQLLTVEERSVLRRLSVFRGGFRREAAKAVAGATLPLLSALVGKSWIRSTPAGRYGMHELVRQYAAERLEQEPDNVQRARDTHSGYYAAFLDERERHLKGRGQGEAFKEILEDIENIRAAWNWATERGNVKDLDRALQSMCLVSRHRGWYREMDETLGTTASLLRQKLHEADRDGWVQLAQRVMPVLSRVLSWQAHHRFRFGSVDGAETLLEESLDILGGVGAGCGRSKASVLAKLMLGWILTSFARDQSRGTQLLQEVLDEASELGDEWSRMYSLWCLSLTGHRSGQHARAEQYLQEGLTLAIREGDQLVELWFLEELARLQWIKGDYQRAKDLAQDSHQLAELLGERVGIATSLRRLGETAAALGMHDLATEYYDLSLIIARDMSDPIGHVESLIGLAAIALDLEEHAQARQALEQGLAMSEMISPWLHCAALVELGYVNRALGEIALSASHFREALALADRAELWPRAVSALAGMAHLLADEAESERALELLALVLRHPATLQVTRDKAQSLRAQLETVLSPDDLAAAMERGQALKLKDVVSGLLGDAPTHLREGRAASSPRTG